MNTLRPMIKDDIELPKNKKEIISIFDSTRLMKEKNLALNSSPNKNANTIYDEKLEMIVIENNKYIDNEAQVNKELEKEFDYYNNKFNRLIEDIMKQRILIKLKRNIMSLVDGRIICFSDLIKIMCSYNSFNYRINLDELDRDHLEKILDYLDIIEWSKAKYLWENKEEELTKWYHSLGNIVEFEEVCIFF